MTSPPHPQRQHSALALALLAAAALALPTSASATPDDETIAPRLAAAKKGKARKGKTKATEAETEPPEPAAPPEPAVPPPETTPEPASPAPATPAAVAPDAPPPTGAAAAAAESNAPVTATSTTAVAGNAAAVAPATATAEEESAVDFDAEETESDRQAQRIINAAGGTASSGATDAGFKLFVDLLADYRVGQKKFEFRPNHFYVLVQARVKDDLSFIIHISEAPVFYELTWNLTPRLALKAGKLLIPFGTNEFHHLFGGRVDELSHFLPETWGDFGVGLTHVPFDGDWLNVEYALYAVNGFEGTDAPLIGTGDASDNNFAKGLGTRVKLDFFGKVVATGSLYFDMWDADNEQIILFYAAGLELRPGLIPVPGLRQLRLRGEWGRGEIQLRNDNLQRGLIPFATMRGGYYGELFYPVVGPVVARVRVGRINPDNRVADDGDVDVWEPAVLLSFGKVSLTFAYQLVARVNRPYAPKTPPDVAYAKFFLQY